MSLPSVPAMLFTQAWLHTTVLTQERLHTHTHTHTHQADWLAGAATKEWGTPAQSAVKPHSLQLSSRHCWLAWMKQTLLTYPHLEVVKTKTVVSQEEPRQCMLGTQSAASSVTGLSYQHVVPSWQLDLICWCSTSTVSFLLLLATTNYPSQATGLKPAIPFPHKLNFRNTFPCKIPPTE